MAHADELTKCKNGESVRKESEASDSPKAKVSGSWRRLLD